MKGIRELLRVPFPFPRRLPSLSESYYGITVVRQLDHPGVRAIVDTARQCLFDVHDSPSPSYKPTS